MISLVLIITYWTALLLGEAIGERNIIPPALSVWMPNFVFLALAIYLFIKVNADEELRLLSLFEQAFTIIEKSAKGLIKVRRGKKPA